MSRIGKKPVTLPAGVTVTAAEGKIKVKGPKGELSVQVKPQVKVEVKAGVAHITNVSTEDDMHAKALHGTTRALLANMVTGVTTGFSRKLEIQGVGYQAKIQGDELHLLVGFSQPAKIKIPAGLKIECPQPTVILISGADKQMVGHMAATIRNVRRPEPYKGKGIRYEGEIVKRKAGKAFASGAT